MSQSEILKAIFKDEMYDTEQNITKMFMECLNFDVSINVIVARRCFIFRESTVFYAMINN